jgi:undecaprenyl-diphosphatase
MTDLWSRLGRHELALLASVLAIAGGLLGFALLADEVREGDTRSFDHTVMLALRTTSDLADPIGPPWVEEMARDLTSLGSITVLTLVSLAVIGFLILHRKRGAAVLVLTAVFGGMLLSTLLKAGFERPRPDLVPHAVVVFTKSFRVDTPCSRPSPTSRSEPCWHVCSHIGASKPTCLSSPFC